jgi:hypothetical protein
MNRLRQIAIVVGLIAFLLTAADSEAGIFRRCRSRSCSNQRSCCNQTAAQYSLPYATCPDGTTCPMYMWANHGSYCSFYALVCSTTTSNSPSNFDCACGSPAGTSCTSCGNTGCTCIIPVDKWDAGRPNVHSDLARDGMRGPPATEFPLDVVAGVTAKKYDINGKKVKLDTQQHKTIVVQIWAMTVDPAGVHKPGAPVDCYIGHQIAGDPDAVADKVTPTQWYKQHACTFDFEGSTYTVVTHNKSP